MNPRIPDFLRAVTRGRVVLWMIFVFTATIMVVMIAYAGRFEWARVSTWVFWPLYLFLPVNSAVFLCGCATCACRSRSCTRAPP